MEYAGTEFRCTYEFPEFTEKKNSGKTDRYPGLSFRMSVGQTAIVMRKQSQRLINEQKIIQLPESILLIRQLSLYDQTLADKNGSTVLSAGIR